MGQVTNEQVQAARRADLYRFLDQRHPNEVRREGNSLRLLDNHSVSVKQGYSGYYDFSNGESGNAVDYLTTYLGYDFQEAVAALCSDGPLSHKPIQVTASPSFILPTPVSGEPVQLMNYLKQHRKIPDCFVRHLWFEGLVYQEATHNNIVFCNYEKTYAELRGSVPGMPFKSMVQGSSLTSCYWFQPFVPASHPDTIYICEGAIDAISLYCIHDALLTRDDMLGNMYCSIGGVANQQRIDAIKKQFPGAKIVIAVDNDLAGQQCRDRNKDCWTCVPTLKDWNDDWRTYYTSFHDMQSQA